MHGNNAITVLLLLLLLLLQFDGGNVLCEVPAHNTPLEVMAWSHDASLLASASTKGTVIRVHRMPQVHTCSAVTAMCDDLEPRCWL